MGATAVAPKKKPLTKKEAGRKKNKNMVRVSDEDHAMLTKMADKNGRKLAAENHQALKDYFQKHGMMPPDPAQK